MSILLAYILGPVLALLPRRWREKVFPAAPQLVARAATLSGILEAVVGLIALVVWYSIYVTLASNAIGGGDERAGLFGYIWFWINPITWMVAYFALEGVIRSLAALTTGEVYPTLPLWAVDYVLRRTKRDRVKRELPLVADEVTPGDATCDIKIAACRERPEWKYPFTIRYGGGYFQVIARADLEAGPRPYVYSLRRLPQGEIARGLKEYGPEDVLTAVQPLEPVEK